MLIMDLTESNRFSVQFCTSNNSMVVLWIVPSVLRAVECSQWTMADIVYQNAEFDTTNIPSPRRESLSCDRHSAVVISLLLSLNSFTHLFHKHISHS
jgi:hypothetical protein